MAASLCPWKRNHLFVSLTASSMKWNCVRARPKSAVAFVCSPLSLPVLGTLWVLINIWCADEWCWEEKYLSFHKKKKSTHSYARIICKYLYYRTLFSSAKFTYHVPGIMCWILGNEIKQTRFMSSRSSQSSRQQDTVFWYLTNMSGRAQSTANLEGRGRKPSVCEPRKAQEMLLKGELILSPGHHLLLAYEFLLLLFRSAWFCKYFRAWFSNVIQGPFQRIQESYGFRGSKILGKLLFLNNTKMLSDFPILLLS